ncbi:MAG: putative peptidase family [Verrucomicrobiaceae bacterium]|nr:putative peptidase family [Verrucomicrobiaceae bacterium]
MLIQHAANIAINARRLAGIFICALALLIQGCATPPQTAALRIENNTDLPQYFEIETVPYFAQEAHQCGPAALAMALGGNGVNVAPEQLEPQIYLPGKQGSLQIEMLAATRRNGLMAYELPPQLRELLIEVAAGKPVIVLQNLSFNWYPVWHYAVVIGYDLDRAEIILRSGPERRQLLAMATFERTWARGNYWALLPLPAGVMPQNANENRYLTATVALEQTHQLTAANTAYTAAIQRWPDNLAALIGLGNIAYTRDNFADAEKLFLTASQQHPDAAVAFNNLADVLARQKKYSAALKAAQQAVKLGGVNSDVFAQTLQEIEEKIKSAH